MIFNMIIFITMCLMYYNAQHSSQACWLAGRQSVSSLVRRYYQATRTGITMSSSNQTRPNPGQGQSQRRTIGRNSHWAFRLAEMYE